MTATRVSPFQRARDLAKEHAIGAGRPVPLAALIRVKEVLPWLDQACRILRRPEAALARAAEWLLDSPHIVRQAVRQIGEDLPSGFYAQLRPLASGDEASGPPRVHAVAVALLRDTEIRLAASTVTRFANAYQESAPLDMAELWALPTMLRLACLQELTGAFERLVPELGSPLGESSEAQLDGPPSLDDSERVARAIRTLRVLSEISWIEFVRDTSVVEAALREDPARVYARMDVDTADCYRDAVETLARGSGHTEVAVARCALDLADGAPTGRSRHVGYWLIGEGRTELEAALGYQPRGKERVRRWALRHPTRLYVLLAGAATAAILTVPAWLLDSGDAGPLRWMVGLALALLPASMFGLGLVQWAVTHVLPPRVLPRLRVDEESGPESRAAVVVPTLIASPADVPPLLDILERHYLSNPEPFLEFVLLTDFTDAPSQHLEQDEDCLRAVTAGIQGLNRRHGRGPAAPFHVLHRERRFNPSEGCWMAWERKRGKLEEFHRWLSGAPGTSFIAYEGHRESLAEVRSVITLDTDTLLPAGTAARLVGALTHPLNRPVIDEESGRVRAGYTIIQPRVETAPPSVTTSAFTRIFAGDTAIDIYSRAVSDTYQDLFGEGIYVGKGIYDVAAFRRLLDSRFADNSLLSHDHLEGLFVRAALASDIVLYEDYPTCYAVYFRRLHRWIRGDWQLLPWLFRARQTARHGPGQRRPFSVIDRWKILDNLRRSLLAPAVLTLLVVAWTGFLGTPLAWTALAVFAPAASLILDLVRLVSRESRRRARRDTTVRLGGGVVRSTARWLLYLVFLPYESLVSLDGVVRTIWRLAWSRRRLLEWTTAAQTAASLAGGGSRLLQWRLLAISPLFALTLGATLATAAPSSLWSAAPFLILWLAAPEIAYRTGRPVRVATLDLEPAQATFLRKLARRTWFFFETFVGPDDHWLPPDNYQEEPHTGVVHRTSPTNIGMMFLATMAARDLGYLGLERFVTRLRRGLEGLARLERYRGHLLNWYDTATLEPLMPRYVSTVDSGNLAASLLALRQGCLEAARRPMLGPTRWQGFLDTIAVLEGDLEGLETGEATALLTSLREQLTTLRAIAAEARDAPRSSAAVIRRLLEGAIPEFDRLLSVWITAEHKSMDQTVLNDLRLWVERLHRHVRNMQQEVDHLLPWLLLLDEAATPRLTELKSRLEASLPPALALQDVPQAVERSRQHVAELQKTLLDGSESSPQTQAWLDRFEQALETAERNARSLTADLRELAGRAEAEALGMDFRLTYDPERRLFHIGYNQTSEQVDPNHYDLLASEARLASLVAIAKYDVPVEHWFALRRPVTELAGHPVLLSWGGTMFEYLMPALLIGSPDGTFLTRSERGAVDAQRGYAARRGVPWGISESGYADVNVDRHYRYRAFGVPDLGLRRGLAEDLVIAPYASALALPLAGPAATQNLMQLTRTCAGTYGLHEAVDFTPARIPEGATSSVVRSYMAHHQGMILAALDNALCGGALVRRFRDYARVRAVELLLQESVPVDAPVDTRLEDDAPVEPVQPDRSARLPAWTPETASASPQVQVLGNGALSSTVSDAGGGGLFWQQYSLTRWTPDPTLDDSGVWVYVQDEESDDLWSVGRQPARGPSHEARAVFQSHAVELHRRHDGIAVKMEIAVAPADDVELRIVTLVNETQRPRQLRVTSYGEVVLAPAAHGERHSAFEKLFIESELRPEFEGLVFRRRTRNPDERPPLLLHRLVHDNRATAFCGHESDRGRFLGRRGTERAPEGLKSDLTGTVGCTLDPLMSLQVRIALDPFASARLAFVTIAARSREALFETAQRYHTLQSLDWVMRDAEDEARREVQRLGIPPEELPALQRLLSSLLYPSSELRCSQESIDLNTLGQANLWGLGISGDLPILLLHAGPAQDSRLLRGLVRAQILWRTRGITIDLVVLWRGGSGYADDAGAGVQAVLKDLQALEWLGRRGGVHLVRSDQVQGEERDLLLVVARATLDDNSGGIEDQLPQPGTLPHTPPPFVPSRDAETIHAAPSLARPGDRQFDNGLGGFSPDGREYWIHLEDGEATPAPWCNVLANAEFGTLVSESGIGCTWSRHSAENRLTPWNNDPVLDVSGEALYLRDEETGEVWTPTPRPAGTGVYQVRHGAGYSEWRHTSQGLEQELEVFVPVGADVKLVRLRLRNTLARSRRVTATYFAEWVLGHVRGLSQCCATVDYDPSLGALLARNSWNAEFASRVAFLVSDRTPHGFTADRTEFLGREGDRRRPAALARWGLTNQVGGRLDPCAVLQVHVDLDDGEETQLLFALGEGDDDPDARRLAAEWRDPRRADRARESLREYWDRLLDTVHVRTPDPAMNVMLNRWLLYQTLSSRIHGRTGFYQPGGAFGFRDQLQDILALLHVDPELARSHVLRCAAAQFEEGDVLHWWHQPGWRGVRTRCSDDLLWLPFATAHYVAATGDRSILEEPVPFLHASPLGLDEDDRYQVYAQGDDVGSLFEHCQRALERGVTRGAHGLPLMGAGDWNDGMNRVGAGGRGESVWLGWFSIAAMSGFADVAESRGEVTLAGSWRRRARSLKQAVEREAWDGEWYLRALDDEGRPWGSAADDECCIDSISQSWSILSGAGDPERSQRALDSAESRLVRPTDQLALLLWPPIDRSSRDPGYIAAYPPGTRENGGQYTHAATWLAWSFARIGDAERATELLRWATPIPHSSDPDSMARYRVEPYVVAGDVASVDPHVGRGGWTWYTGASGWTWRLGVEAILGLGLCEGQLRVDPCIPRAWGGFEATIRNADGVLRIRVEDPDSVGGGVVKLRLDGIVVAGCTVSLPRGGAEHELIVTLGRPSRTNGPAQESQGDLRQEPDATAAGSPEMDA